MSLALMTNADAIASPPSSGKMPRKNRFRADGNNVLRKYQTHANAVMP